MTERLKETPASELVAGDEFVVPGFLQVYGVKDGYATLSATLAGTRYRVESVAGRELTAMPLTTDGLRLAEPKARTERHTDRTTVLKVVAS
jgi:hypothetical protein